MRMSDWSSDVCSSDLSGGLCSRRPGIGSGSGLDRGCRLVQGKAMLARTLVYAADAPPAAGSVEEVAPGLLWVRLPLPFALDHVNLCALADGHGWFVVDSGFAAHTVRPLCPGLVAGPRDRK